MAKTTLPAPITPKVSAPDVTGAVIRTDQLDTVAAAAGARVLVVHAPAGYGKTTLLASASRELGWRCVWYRLDELDRRPSLLVRTLNQSLAAHIPGFGDALGEQLGTSRHAVQPIEESISLLATELAERLDGDLYIILDECEQLARLPETARMLRLLQAGLPATVHLVLLTREEPALPLARLHLREEVAEIHEDTLRFDLAQTRAFLESRSQAGLTDNEVRTLVRLTDGWPAGIELATKALAWRDFASLAEVLSRPRLRADVFAFLAEEVFDRQSVAARRFLLRTCCVDFLTRELVHRLVEQPDAERQLAHLVANRIFTFADSDGRAFRYHPLFREFLCDRLRTEKGPAGIRKLQLSSARALEETGDYERAVGLLLELAEPGLVLDLFAGGGAQSVDDCSSRCLEDVVAILTGKEVRSRAWALFLESQLCDRRGERPQAMATARKALRLFGQAGDDRGRFLVLRALQLEAFYADEHRSAIGYAHEALDIAPNAGERCRLLSMEVQSWLFLGELAELRRVLAKAEAVVANAGPEAAARHAGIRATVAFVSGDVRAALLEGRAALELMRSSASITTIVSFTGVLADMHLQAAEYGAAERLAEECQAMARRYGMVFLAAFHVDVMGQVRGATGHAKEAIRILEDAIASPALAQDPQGIAGAHVHLGGLLRRAGELARAELHFTAALEAVTATENRLDRIAAQANLAFTHGLCDPGMSGVAVQELRRLHQLSRKLGFRLQAGQCDFFAAALLFRTSRRDGASRRPLTRLAACVARMLDLGLLHFPCQEFCHDPRLFGALIRAGLPASATAGLLDAVARGPGAARLLIDVMPCGEEAAMAALDAAGRHLNAGELSRVLDRVPRRRWVTVRRRAEQIRRARGLAQDAEQILFPELTTRERQILALMAEGRRNTDMARELSLSEATVKTHVHRVLSRLSVSNRLEAALLYRSRTERA